MNSNYYYFNSGSLMDVTEKYLKRPTDYGSLPGFCRIILTLLLRGGFLMLQIQNIPSDNVHRVILQNIVEVSISTIFYGVAGFTLAYGSDIAGLFGCNIWLRHSPDVDLNNAIYGWCTIVMSNALIVTVLSGRVKTIAIIIMAIINSIILYPVLIHMTSTEGGFLYHNVVAEQKVAFKDYGGGAIIHMSGGLFALIACMILGERIIKMQELDEYGMTDDAPGLSIIAYVLILIGLCSTSLPSPLYEITHVPDNYVGNAMLNYLMAFAGGFIIMTLLQTALRGGLYTYWTTLCCVQGGIAGVVTASSAPDVHIPVVSVLNGALGSALCYFLEQLMYKTNLEDYCNIVAIHLGCGLLGSLMCAITACGDSMGITRARHLVGYHFLWQFIGVLVILAYTLAVALCVLFGLYLCRALRNSNEIRNNKRAKRLRSSIPPGQTNNLVTMFSRVFHLTNHSRYLQPLSKNRKRAELLAAKGQKYRTGWSSGDFFSNAAPPAEFSVGYTSIESRFNDLYPSYTRRNKPDRYNRHVRFSQESMDDVMGQGDERDGHFQSVVDVDVHRERGHDELFDFIELGKLGGSGQPRSNRRNDPGVSDTSDSSASRGDHRSRSRNRRDGKTRSLLSDMNEYRLEGRNAKRSLRGIRWCNNNGPSRLNRNRSVESDGFRDDSVLMLTKSEVDMRE